MNKRLIIAAAALFAMITPALAQVAGPYKGEMVEMTGDACPDLVLGYHAIGVVTVEQGDCSAGFTRIAVNEYSTAPEALGDRHVHNIMLADVDGDGKKDLVAAIGGLDPSHVGTIIVAKNMGAGVLTEQVRFTVPSQAKGVHLADFDGDGKIDLAATARGRNEGGDLAVGRLYLWKGLGGFSFDAPIYVETGRSSYDIELGDLDGDGHADFLVPNERTETFNVVLNPGSTLFTATLTSTAYALPSVPGYPSHTVNHVRVADFNGDGDLDAAVATHNSGLVAIWHGKGDGTFDAPQIMLAGLNSAYMDICDIDGNGTPDIAVAHYTGIQQTSVFVNAGGESGVFPRQAYPTGLGSYGITCENYDGATSPHLDLITTNYSSRTISFMRGKGDGTFFAPVSVARGLKLVGGNWVSE